MTALTIFAGEAAPSEFRIFAAGLNTTRNGDYLFDEKAAADVMAAYQAHGTDLMIDLEHLSLNDDSRSYDPDARGWSKLEVRNGELWAAQVSWTPDGETRLREKRQRYISPVFKFDEKTRRVVRMLNIAITAMPATDNLSPLVAANQLNTEGASPMTPEQFAQVAEALGLGADANVEDVLATVAAMVKKIQDAANGNAEPDKAEKPPAEGTPAAAAEAAPPVVAAARMRIAALSLAKLSGKKDIGEVVSEVEAWHTSHVELEQSRAKLAQDRATLEGGERRRLVGELVKLGMETPATAWANDDGKTPAEPWASMPIAQLRDRVAKLSGKGPSGTRTPPRPAPVSESKGGQIVTVNGDAVDLSASEVAACKDAGAKLEDYAANKLIRTRARAAASG